MQQQRLKVRPAKSTSERELYLADLLPQSNWMPLLK